MGMNTHGLTCVAGSQKMNITRQTEAAWGFCWSRRLVQEVDQTRDNNQGAGLVEKTRFLLVTEVSWAFFVCFPLYVVKLTEEASPCSHSWGSLKIIVATPLDTGLSICCSTTDSS